MTASALTSVLQTQQLIRRNSYYNAVASQMSSEILMLRSGRSQSNIAESIRLLLFLVVTSPSPRLRTVPRSFPDGERKFFRLDSLPKSFITATYGESVRP